MRISLKKFNDCFDKEKVELEPMAQQESEIFEQTFYDNNLGKDN